VEFPNGSRIRLFGADNPDGARGIYLDGVVLDEVGQMKPEVWGTIIRPTLVDRNGWALFIGTPKGINLFSQLYNAALKEENGWKTDLRRASDTGVIPHEELEHLRKTLSPQEFAQEFDCDFSAATENSLLGLSEVLEAQERTISSHQYYYAAKILGVDVARYGDDLTVLQGRQGLLASKPKHMGGLDTMAVAGHVAREIDLFKPAMTFVDTGGIGAGVIDRLLQLGHVITPVDFGSKSISPRFENKRAEMWVEMANWVKAGGCLPKVERLAQDLVAPRYDYANARGKFQLESKDKMRARGLPSTDFGDALACTFAFPVAIPSLAFGGSSSISQQHTVHDFDPFAERSS
jgi:hypothetical protein